MATSTVDTGGSVGRFGVVKNNLVATGSSQAGAFPLGNHVGHFEVATVASGTGVVLPANRIPAILVVKNAGANSLSVYPPPGSAIDNGTVNAAYPLASGSTCLFWANSLSNWYSAAYGTTSGGGATYAVARFLVGPDSDIVVANGIGNWTPLVGSGTLTGAFVTSKTGDGPVGAALILDLKLSTDGGSTFTSLWHTTPSNRPTIADGGVVGSAGAPDTTSYTNGNLVRLDVVQVGSTTPGRNVFVALY